MMGLTAEWAGVLVGVIGIVATIGIAVGGFALKARREHKVAEQARLHIATTRWAPNGLRLEILYAPASSHAAIKATLAVKTLGMRLYLGRPVVNPAPMVTGGYIRYEFDGECVEGIGTVSLLPADIGELRGVMFLLPDGSGEWLLRQAKIEVSIRETSGETLLTRSLVVSAIVDGGSPSSLPKIGHPAMQG
jgi:hypothetical protein